MVYFVILSEAKSPHRQAQEMFRIRSTWRDLGGFRRGGFQTLPLQDVTLFNFWNGITGLQSRRHLII